MSYVHYDCTVRGNHHAFNNHVRLCYNICTCCTRFIFIQQSNLHSNLGRRLWNLGIHWQQSNCYLSLRIRECIITLHHFRFQLTYQAHFVSAGIKGNGITFLDTGNGCALPNGDNFHLSPVLSNAHSKIISVSADEIVLNGADVSSITMQSLMGSPV